MFIIQFNVVDSVDWALQATVPHACCALRTSLRGNLTHILPFGWRAVPWETDSIPGPWHFTGTRFGPPDISLKGAHLPGEIDRRAFVIFVDQNRNSEIFTVTTWELFTSKSELKYFLFRCYRCWKYIIVINIFINNLSLYLLCLS